MIPRRRDIKTIQGFLLVLSSALGFGCANETSASLPPPSARCASCHLPEFRSVTNPPHAGVRPTTCGTCHSEDSWHPDRLQHSWPLEGAHTKVDCFKCHQQLGVNSAPNLVFEGTPKNCAPCHAAARQQANSRVHNHALFPDTCESCHSVKAWKPTLPHKTPQPAAIAPSAPTVSSAAPHKSPPAPARRKAAPSAPVKPSVITPTPTPARKPDVTSGASKVR